VNPCGPEGECLKSLGHARQVDAAERLTDRCARRGNRPSELAAGRGSKPRAPGPPANSIEALDDRGDLALHPLDGAAQLGASEAVAASGCDGEWRRRTESDGSLERRYLALDHGDNFSLGAGPQTLHVWQRECGARVDVVALTTSSTPPP
jgi:hypothetical protein